MWKEKIENSGISTDVVTRVKVAIPAAVIVIGIVLFGDQVWVGFLVTLIAIIGMWEFVQMTNSQLPELRIKLLLGVSIFTGICTIIAGRSGLDSSIILSNLLVVFYYLLFSPAKKIAGLQELGASLFGVIWIPWSLHHLTLIKGLENGTAFLFLLVIIIWVSDIAAYFGGKRFGKIPLAPSISPKKTVEGSLIGLMASAVIAYGFVSLLGLSFLGWKCLILGVVIAAIGQAGDLIESKWKRLCDVKDSGNIMPGHGGVLDRIDGFLPATPIFYYFLIL